MKLYSTKQIPIDVRNDLLSVCEKFAHIFALNDNKCIRNKINSRVRKLQDNAIIEPFC